MVALRSVREVDFFEIRAGGGNLLKPNTRDEALRLGGDPLDAEGGRGHCGRRTTRWVNSRREIRLAWRRTAKKRFCRGRLQRRRAGDVERGAEEGSDAELRGRRRWEWRHWAEGGGRAGEGRCSASSWPEKMEEPVVADPGDVNRRRSRRRRSSTWGGGESGGPEAEGRLWMEARRTGGDGRQAEALRVVAGRASGAGEDGGRGDAEGDRGGALLRWVWGNRGSGEREIGERRAARWPEAEGQGKGGRRRRWWQAGEVGAWAAFGGSSDGRLEGDEVHGRFGGFEGRKKKITYGILFFCLFYLRG